MRHVVWYVKERWCRGRDNEDMEVGIARLSSNGTQENERCDRKDDLSHHNRSFTRALDQVRSKFGNQLQNVADQIPRDDDFGHLEGVF
jgi:hypothetical protein